MQIVRLVNQQKGLCWHVVRMTLAFILALAAASSLIAGSSSATINVSAVVAANCKVHSGAVQFGTYDPASVNETSALNAAGNLQISCTKNTTAAISIDQGQNASQAAGTSRAMKSTTGSAYLSYDLYLDASRSTVWNSTNQATYTAAGGAAPSTLTIYGKVPGNQDVSDGQYSDVVTVTAVF